MAGQIKEKPKGYPPLVAITESCRGWRSAKGVVNFVARGPRPTWLLSQRGGGGAKTKEHFRRHFRAPPLSLPRPSFEDGELELAFFFPSSRNSANNSPVKRTKAVVEHAYLREGGPEMARAFTSPPPLRGKLQREEGAFGMPPSLLTRSTRRGFVNASLIRIVEE